MNWHVGCFSALRTAHYVDDNFRDLDGDVVAWDGYFVHSLRVHPCAADHSDRSVADSGNSGKAANLKHSRSRNNQPLDESFTLGG